jgi:hypothetical protein
MIPAEDAVAGDHVIDVDRIEVGPLAQRGEAAGEQGLWVNRVQPAVGAASPAGRAYRVENPGVDGGLRSSWSGSGHHRS